MFEAEVQLLKDRGHEVLTYQKSNDEINGRSVWSKTHHLLHLHWNQETYLELTGIIKEFQPEIAHFHNTFFMMTPSVYYACHDQKIPIIQSLHNFRMMCCNALFLRNNKPCEDCLTYSHMRGIMHGCYKNSRILSALVTKMNQYHKKRKTWECIINGYIVGSEFTKSKYVAYGIDEDKIFVKPNCLYPEPENESIEANSRYSLYVGRLDVEKGIEALLEAWDKITDYKLMVAGAGPMKETVERAAQNNHNIEYLGLLDQQKVQALIRTAQFVIVPSVCYENFPRVIAESFAFQTPVLTSRLGSLSEIIKEGETGEFIDEMNSSKMASKINQMFADEAHLEAMGLNARKYYEEHFSSEVIHNDLTNIYSKIIINNQAPTK